MLAGNLQFKVQTS